jgi:hypothetical protein
VDVNEQSAKPAKALRPGDLVRVTLPQGRRRILKVLALDDRRGSATIARALYDDLTPPEPPRPRWAAPPARLPGAGRPTKRERRALDACASLSARSATRRRAAEFASDLPSYFTSGRRGPVRGRVRLGGVRVRVLLAATPG